MELRRSWRKLRLWGSRGDLREGVFLKLVVGLVLLSIRVSGIIVVLIIVTVRT